MDNIRAHLFKCPAKKTHIDLNDSRLSEGTVTVKENLNEYASFIPILKFMNQSFSSDMIHQHISISRR